MPKSKNHKKKNHKKPAHEEPDLDNLEWLRNIERQTDESGETLLQLEYHEDDEILLIMHQFLARSVATKKVAEAIFAVWQETVLTTLLASTALWKQETITSTDQKAMKDLVRFARFKVNFILHHLVGSIFTSEDNKWQNRRDDVLLCCQQALALLPRLAESIPHHPTDIRRAMAHFEGKEFLACVACEIWDTLYDYSVRIDPEVWVPVLRKCAMLDILDKDWNMLGGWEDILKGLEARCCPTTGPIRRIPTDAVLNEQTTIWRNARNSLQCKFFSVRFLRYTEDQAPQRWRYFPKCSAPACAHLEQAGQPHPYRCGKCWYFHYCSLSCMEYCDNILQLHAKFCQDTPAHKALLCKKETAQYLGREQTDFVQCRACGMALTEKRRCGQCQKVFYCSRQCQEWDWRVGGHMELCKKLQKGILSETTDVPSVPLASNASTLPDAPAVKDLN